MTAQNNTLSVGQTLLVELVTEELPPKALKALGESFSQSILKSLQAAGLCEAQAAATAFASPRRLAVRIAGVLAKANDQPLRVKLLPVAIGLDTKGEPTAPLIKKLASLGLVVGENLALTDLQRETDGKQEVLVVQTTKAGLALPEALQQALDEALAGLPIPKVMRYAMNGQEVKFVRPAHFLVALHGTEALNVQALGLQSGRTSLGHRFHCPEPLTIESAESWQSQLQTQGHVFANFAERQALIVEALQKAGGTDQVVMPQALLDEVTSLVECPVVLEGHFEEDFLQVPQECLILTMQQNQKYFAVTDAEGRLRNRFLLVANLVSQDPQKVVQGNERVIRARLSDAKFFYDQDRLKPLADRLTSLDAVIYHNKIGSQGQRIQRLEQLASSFATALHVNSEDAARAARLAKADLATDMVGEFPELQGVMGQYYALHEGESKEVAAAIEGHYHPRFAGDSLASNGLGLAVALADKTELLVGIWGIGLIPSGEKDPFGLRRAALGILRMLIETPVELSLSELVTQGQKSFEKVVAVKPETEAVLNFLFDRARGYLKDQGYPAEAIEAVLAECPDKPWQWLPRLQAVHAFLSSTHAAALCAANKRIGNILKKASADDVISSVKSELLVEANEKALAQALAQTAPQAEALAAAGKYQESLESLALLKAPVDAFFEAVMVNADDLVLRANRIALLGQTHRAMNQVADLARLAVNT